MKDNLVWVMLLWGHASLIGHPLQTLHADASTSERTIDSPLSLYLTLPLTLCQPLPETEYNGNPESVGYRIQVWRAARQGDASTKVINNRLEREITLEGLEEWTEYLFQIQAFNSIGPGPWSEPVKGRTRESGTETLSQTWTHTQPHVMAFNITSAKQNTHVFVFIWHILSRDGFLNECGFPSASQKEHLEMFIPLVIDPLDMNRC